MMSVGYVVVTTVPVLIVLERPMVVPPKITAVPVTVTAVMTVYRIVLVLGAAT